MPSTVAFAPPSQPPAIEAPESREQVEHEAGEFKPFGADGLTFDDILDIVNPLHHLPLVGFIYRAISGDTISPASRISGGALFGGVIGFATALADTVLEQTSGKDAGGHVLAFMEDAQGTSSETGGTKDAPWSDTASLRHDRNEHDDEFSEPVSDETGNTASAGPAPGGEFQASQIASLRHDAHDNEDGWWEDPDTVTGAKNVAAGQPSAPAAPAAPATPVASPPAAPTSAPGTTRVGPAKAAAAAENHPATTGAAQISGPRARAATLARPRTHAANPATVTTQSSGESRYFRPGGTINTDAWLKLMNNVTAKSGTNTAPTGSNGLASATLAKALATYGAAQAGVPKPGQGPIRP